MPVLSIDCIYTMVTTVLISDKAHHTVNHNVAIQFSHSDSSEFEWMKLYDVLQRTAESYTLTIQAVEVQCLHTSSLHTVNPRNSINKHSH